MHRHNGHTKIPGLWVALTGDMLQLRKDVVNLRRRDGFARPLLLPVTILEVLLATPQPLDELTILVHYFLAPLGNYGRVVDLFPPVRLRAKLARELPHPEFNKGNWFTAPADERRGELLMRRGLSQRIIAHGAGHQ